MRYTRTQTVLKTTPASWRDSHSRRAKGSPLSSARRCGRQRAQHRRVQVAKRVAEVLQREAVQGERRVRQHVPRPNNAQHSALRGAPAVDTTCSEPWQRSIEACRWVAMRAAHRRGTSKAINFRVDCGVPRAHEHIRRVLDGLGRHGVGVGCDEAETPRRTPVTTPRRRCLQVWYKKSLTKRRTSRPSPLRAVTCTWPFACATDGHRFGQPSSLSQSESVCWLDLLVGTRLHLRGTIDSTSGQRREASRPL